MDNILNNISERLHRAEVILIGGSAGAFTLIFDIIKLLPSNYAQTIIVVIHRGKNNYSDIENLFNSNCNIPVREIADKDNIDAGMVYITPANYHTLIERNKTFALDVSESVWYSKPAIDVTFENAANVYGDKCAGILLSGANQDGAEGLLKLRTCGALTIVQDPEDAEMSTMPQAAVDIHAAEYILKADEVINIMRSNN